MTWWHRLFRRRKNEADLEKELRFHLDQHANDLIAQGHSPGEAQRLARLALGGPEQVKENCRCLADDRRRGGRYRSERLQRGTPQSLSAIPAEPGSGDARRGANAGRSGEPLYCVPAKRPRPGCESTGIGSAFSRRQQFPV